MLPQLTDCAVALGDWDSDSVGPDMVLIGTEGLKCESGSGIDAVTYRSQRTSAGTYESTKLGIYLIHVFFSWRF